MALIDLVSDLKNFKYDQTSPDKIDAQIKKGVDFIPNTDAPGFTPKTDLESLYHKVKEGTVAPVGGNVKYYANLNPIGGRLSSFGDSSRRVPMKQTTPPRNNPNYDAKNYPYNSKWDVHVSKLTSLNIEGYTLNIQPGGFSINNPQYPNAVGNTLLPEPNLFDFTVFRDRTRDVYQGHYLNSPFANIPLPGLFSPNYDVRTRDLWQAGSINIFDGDTQEPIGGRVSQFANLLIGNQRTSQFSRPERVNETNTYTLPDGFSGTQTTFSLPKESFRYSTSDTTDTFQSSFYVSNIVGKKRKKKIDKLQEFKFGTFTNVPSGLNEQNKFGTKSYRAVADPHNFDLFRQPFILREYGNRWGSDSISAENPLGAFLGGFVRGAPGITGLISRSITDKFRIGKFLLTSKGLGFIGRQFILQGLNPTLESKIWNPLSVFSVVGAADAYEAIGDAIKGMASSGGNFMQLAEGLAGLAATVAFPIGHPERHIGEGRYSRIVPLKSAPDFIKESRLLPQSVKDALKGDFTENPKLGYGSRIAMQSNPEIFPEVTIDLGMFGGEQTIGGASLQTSMILMNPNKYLFPISSAPKWVGTNSIGFTGAVDQAEADAFRIENKGSGPDQYTGGGGTFNKKTNAFFKDEEGLIKRHSTMAYQDLNKDLSYEELLVTPSEGSFKTDRGKKTIVPFNSTTIDKRFKEKLVNQKIGVYNGNTDARRGTHEEVLGEIKGNAKSDNVDKVNMIPYGSADKDGALPLKAKDNPDFIKFRFYDMVNKKWIIFRAILEGISDSIAPDYSDEKYVGRPDKVYVYQGTDRNISFTFSIYPKTKQELPVLMEKLNYLVGLCYPSYTEEERMITPFMSLTLGDMFVNAPGLLSSLNVTVEDTSTWELDEGLQFPHYIKAACEFKYIGSNVLASKGKHYGIDWIPDGSVDSVEGSPTPNRFTDTNALGFNEFPSRKPKWRPFFRSLDQNQPDPQPSSTD